MRVSGVIRSWEDCWVLVLILLYTKLDPSCGCVCFRWLGCFCMTESYSSVNFHTSWNFWRIHSNSSWFGEWNLRPSASQNGNRSLSLICRAPQLPGSCHRAGSKCPWGRVRLRCEVLGRERKAALGAFVKTSISGDLGYLITWDIWEIAADTGMTARSAYVYQYAYIRAFIRIAVIM